MRYKIIIWMFTVGLILAGDARSQTVYETAVKDNRPDYVPKYSDVVMRSLSPRTGTTWQTNTLIAAEAYHATCLYWVYPGTNESWVNNMRANGLAIHSSVHHWQTDSPWNSTYALGRALNVYGNTVTPLPDRITGCVNRWEYRQVWLNWTKYYADIDYPSIQQDAPHCNELTTGIEPGENPITTGPGCFCEDCMFKFHFYLQDQGLTSWAQNYPTNNFANTFLAKSGFTVFMVSKSPTSSFGVSGNAMNGSGGVPRLYLTRNSLSYDTSNTVTISSTADATEITTFTHDGIQTASMYKNGVLQSSNNSSPVVNSFLYGHLALPFQSSSLNQPGDLAELIIYDRNLTTGERSGVEAYLGGKYGGVTGTAMSPDENQLGFNLKLWLKAEDLSANHSDGSPVNVWSAAAGFDAIIPSLTLPNGQIAGPPTYKANVINGRPVVRFDGVDDFMSFEWFNFRNYVYNYVTDRNLQLAPEAIKNTFMAFQKLSDREFYPSIRAELDAYAGRHIPMSDNNMKHWESLHDLFDFGMAELHHEYAMPHDLYADFHTATPQVYTMPVPYGNGIPYNYINSWDTWDTQFPQLRIQTRKCIAMAYALGGHVMVPWDQYMPYENPRYYGDPADYHYLFKLVRDHPEYFDGYDNAYITGYDLNDSRYNAPYPITIIGGSGQVSASVRAKAGDEVAPAVIHLVEWNDVSPQPFELRIERSRFFGAREHHISMIFHDEQANTEYTVNNYGNYSTVSVPALNTWAMVIVSTTTCGTWGFHDMDFNKDCFVDFEDFALFAAEWLKCTRPSDGRCTDEN